MNSIITCCFLLLFTSCANIVNLTGGPKDISKPILISTEPNNLSTGFKGSKILFFFDENIQLNNPNKEILMAPRPKGSIKYSSNKGVFQIYIEEVLESNTTYQINLGNAIGDFNENNLAESISLTFSTGDIIDSFSICGHILLPAIKPNYSSFKVGLYDIQKADSANAIQKPIYLSDVDATGAFCFNYLPKKAFNLLMFNNVAIDNIDYTAFLDSIQSNSINTFTDTIQAFLKESSNIQTNQINKGRLTVKNVSQDYTNQTYLQGNDTLLCTYSISTNTLFVWISPNNPNKVIYHYNEQILLDSITPQDKLVLPELSMLGDTFLVSDSNTALISLNQPVLHYGNQLFTIESADSNVYIQHIKIDSNLTTVQLTLSKKPLAPILLTIDSGGLYGLYGVNKKMFIPLKVDAQNISQSLTIHLSPFNEKHYTYLELFESEGQETINKVKIAGPTIKINDLKPGKYGFRLYRDINNNGYWDTGNPDKMLQPEPLRYYQELIEIKPNWDAEIKY